MTDTAIRVFELNRYKPLSPLSCSSNRSNFDCVATLNVSQLIFIEARIESVISFTLFLSESKRENSLDIVFFYQ